MEESCQGPLTPEKAEGCAVVVTQMEHGLSTDPEPGPSSSSILTTAPANLSHFPIERGFQSVPAEILVEIFAYLEFGDLLELRATCKIWNNVISNWTRFTQKASFTVNQNISPSNDSKSVLRNSNVEWKNIILEECTNPTGPLVNFQAYLHPCLTSLSLVDCSFTWTWMKEVTGAQHPFLHKLSIVNCTRTIEQDEGWFQTPALFTGFMEFQQRVTDLKFQGNNLQTLNFFMRQFTPENQGQALLLTSFEITVDPNPVPHGNNQDGANFSPNFGQFTEHLSKLLASCQNSLKSLKIYTGFNLTTCVMRSLRGVQDREIALNLTEFHYQWVDSDKFAHARLYEHDERTLVRFLKLQPNLKSLGLPKVGRHGRFTGTQLPTMIHPVLEEIDIGFSKARLSTNLFTASKVLNTIKLALNHYEGPFLNADPDAVDRPVFPQVKHFTISGRGFTAVRFHIDRMAQTFPYLETLIITANGESCVQGVSDNNLQTIIRCLPNLKILTLSLSNLVSDFGVAGIRRSDCAKLLQSKSLYLEQELSVLGVNPSGVPLSALKFLREITFTCSSSDISDVGIHYGFNFQDLRKLNIVCDYELSDWGLVQLARLNPLLEQCSVVTSSTILSPECKALFVKLLPRVKRNLSIVSAVMTPFSDDEVDFNSDVSDDDSDI